MEDDSTFKGWLSLSNDLQTSNKKDVSQQAEQTKTQNWKKS